MLIYVTGWLHGYNKAHSKSLCPTCRNKTKKLVENMIMSNQFINLPYNLGKLAILKRQPEK